MPKQTAKRRSRKGLKSPAQREPWLNRTQKIIATIISVLVLSGMVWTYGAKADARYAKDAEVKKEMTAIKTDVAMLGKAFQTDQLDRAIDRKQDILIKIEMRLNEKISPRGRTDLEIQKRQTEFEIQKLKEKQQNLN